MQVTIIEVQEEGVRKLMVYCVLYRVHGPFLPALGQFHQAHLQNMRNDRITFKQFSNFAIYFRIPS